MCIYINIYILIHTHTFLPVELSEGWNQIDGGTRGAGKGEEERQDCPCKSSQTSNWLWCIVKSHREGEGNRK